MSSIGHFSLAPLVLQWLDYAECLDKSLRSVAKDWRIFLDNIWRPSRITIRDLGVISRHKNHILSALARSKCQLDILLDGDELCVDDLNEVLVLGSHASRIRIRAKLRTSPAKGKLWSLELHLTGFTDRALTWATVSTLSTRMPALTTLDLPCPVWCKLLREDAGEWWSKISGGMVIYSPLWTCSGLLGCLLDRQKLLQRVVEIQPLSSVDRGILRIVHDAMREWQGGPGLEGNLLDKDSLFVGRWPLTLLLRDPRISGSVADDFSKHVFKAYTVAVGDAVF